MNPSTPSPDRRARWQAIGLWALAATFLAFGFLAEVRGAFLRRPMTDAQVYFRAAWAARTGGDIYTVTDDNHWHYHYPPLLAVLAAPLADAPRGPTAPACCRWRSRWASGTGSTCRASPPASTSSPRRWTPAPPAGAAAGGCCAWDRWSPA